MSSSIDAQQRVASASASGGAVARAASAQPSPLMLAALRRIGSDWGAYPSDVFVRTIDALTKRGLIEERRNDTGTSSRWQYRLTPAGRAAIAEATGGV